MLCEYASLGNVFITDSAANCVVTNATRRPAGWKYVCARRVLLSTENKSNSDKYTEVCM
jgi:hypothetical protein